MTPPSLVSPPPLDAGARIAILSPSGPVLSEHIDTGARILRQWGFEVMRTEQLLVRSQARPYLAGTDAIRHEALTAAMWDPSIDAIICSRGGYGAMRLLPELDAGRWRAHPKLLVGFSDITALHLWSVATAGVATLHGPVLKSFRLHPTPDEDPAASLEHLHRALRGQRGGFALSGLKTVRGGTAQGPLIGGNLSLVTAMLATPYCPDLRGALLFVEDVGEEDYRLDRLFTTLRLSDKARDLGALLLGDFTGCGGVYIPDARVDEYVAELAGEFGIPAVAGMPIGHDARNVALPVGPIAHLDADDGVLTLTQDAVQRAAP